MSYSTYHVIVRKRKKNGEYGKPHTYNLKESGQAEVFARSMRAQGHRAEVKQMAHFPRRTGSH